MKKTLHIKYLSIFICLLFACSKTKTWYIPLHNDDSILELTLPCDELNTLTRHINQSDCTTCGRHYTVISNEEFSNKIPDHISYFSNWTRDKSAPAILYIDEALHKHSTLSEEEVVMDKELKALIQHQKEIDPWVNIIDTVFTDQMAMIRYKASKQSGLDRSEKIQCHIKSNNKIIQIHYIQHNNLNNYLTQIVWDHMQNMRILKKHN